MIMPPDLCRNCALIIAGYNRAMNTAKDEVRKLLDHLPDNATFEDIQYQVYVLDEIRRGSEEIERGEGLDHADVKRRLARWLGK